LIKPFCLALRQPAGPAFSCFCLNEREIGEGHREGWKTPAVHHPARNAMLKDFPAESWCKPLGIPAYADGSATVGCPDTGTRRSVFASKYVINDLD
jgi:hypothetical protein